MTLASKVKFFLREPRRYNAFYGFFISSSHQDHYLTMFFLYLEIGMDFFYQVVKGITRDVGLKNILPFKVFKFLKDCFFPVVNSQKTLNPLKHGFVYGRDLYYGSVDNWKFSRLGLHGIDVKTTVPVDVSGKICKCSVFCFHVNCLRAVYEKRKLFSTVNDLANELRKKMRKSELVSKAQEFWAKIQNRLFKGQKSNRLPILNAAAARLSQWYRESSDILVRKTLEQTASVVNCVGGVNGDLPTEMSVSDVTEANSVLQNNSGEYISNMVGGENKFGTSPVGDSYLCMLTTRMIPVLYNMSGFIKKFQYPNIGSTLSSEVGGVNNVRFFASEQGSVTPSASLLGNDVANCFISAREGYKVVWPVGGRAKFIYMPPGTLNDPAMLRQSAACTFYQGSCITNDLWVMNLRSTGFR